MKNYYLLKFLLLFVCINLTNNVLAQISQVVQIVVVNFNQKPIENVSLIIEDISKAQFFIITDANGIAQASLPVGTYQITAKQLGYAPQSVHDVEVTSGKEINLTIQLTENNFHLPETEITPSKSSTNIGIEISKNEILRSPSSLNDPVRLAALYPGVQLTNDQANHISYRGNDPLFVNWSINGLEVASPNHLSNAGVIGDLPSQSGGGVNILNAQILQKAVFSPCYATTNYNNAISGVFDLQLRNGNNQRFEAGAQVSLIGTDVLLEGPALISKNSSFLVNYRYSTLGLLGKMGVELGDEKIDYQDASANLNLPFKNGNVKLFGVYGKSRNEFDAKDSTEIKVEKDLYNINYKGNYYATGGTISFYLQPGFTIYAGVALSANGSDYNKFTKDNIPKLLNESSWKKQTVEMGITYQSKVFTYLSSFKLVRFQIRNSLADVITCNYLDKKGNLSIGTVKGIYKFSDRWELAGSLRYNLTTVFNFNLQPNLRLTYKNKNNQLFGDLSTSSQIIPALQLYSKRPIYAHNIGQFYSTTVSLGDIFEKGNFINKATVYYQQINNLYPLNRFQIPPYFINNQEIFGAEFQHSKTFNGNFYYNVNLSLLTARDSFLQKRVAVTNAANLIVNVSAGREWSFKKQKKTSIFGVGCRMIYSSGKRYTPIDLAASIQAQTTIFDFNEFNSLRLPDYSKLDVRVYWKQNRKKFASMIALDILNVTNRKNISNYFYDSVTQNEKQPFYELGLIPNISYKIDFGL